MKFSNHRAVGVPFKKAAHTGGAIRPSLILLHDTAGRITKGNAAAYLRDNDVNVSVHFVVERDGSIEQQVPINRRANHAGRSHYHGRKHVNAFSVGIELVNPGKMIRGKDGFARTWYGEEFGIADYGIQVCETDEHGRGLWMPYPEEQIAALISLLQGLRKYRPSLTDVRPHWYVSPGRKVDTNPLFPLEHIRSLILGREDPQEDEADNIAADLENGVWAETVTPGDALNMRRWPSFNPNVIAAIPHGTLVPVSKRGEFDGRSWAKVAYAGQEGWVIERYLSASVEGNK